MRAPITLLPAVRADQHAASRPAGAQRQPLTRCTGCGGLYVGAGAHGRNGFYRCYVCHARQMKGSQACDGLRLPAGDLEQAVLDALLRTYDHLDLFDLAVRDALAAATVEQPRLEQQLASTETQIRETTAALDRYLRVRSRRHA